MVDWKTYKGEGPWPLVQQESKFGYNNNPNFTSIATDKHIPCGHWHKLPTHSITTADGETMGWRSWYNIAMDITGKYVALSVYNGMAYQGGLCVSNDYCKTFQWIYPYLVSGGHRIQHTRVSSTGQYQYALDGPATITYYSVDYGAHWTINSLGTNYNGMSMSDDGRYVLCFNSSKVYTSSDYGTTWITRSFANSYSCAMSADGKYQGIDGMGTIYRSIDYGATWATLPKTETRSLAISADGKYWFFGTGYVSSDYGATKSLKITLSIDSPVTCSTSGQYVSLCSQVADPTIAIQVSSDYGEHWTAKSSIQAPGVVPSRIAMSADGQYQTMLAGSIIIASIDYGATWASRKIVAPQSIYRSDANMSADGKIQLVNVSGLMWFSGDYGLTWNNFLRYTLDNQLVIDGINNESVVWPLK